MRGEEILEAARRRKESIHAEAEPRELLKFSLNEELYGISIEDVVEVIRCPRIFSVPHTPDYIMGVINLRGEILSIIDIRKLLGLVAVPWDNLKHIIVVEHGSVRVGIMVDRAADVVSISDSVVKPPLSASDRPRGLITGEAQLPDGTVMAILDLNTLLEE